MQSAVVVVVEPERAEAVPLPPAGTCGASSPLTNPSSSAYAVQPRTIPSKS